jgi:hypothetical protein
MKRIPRLELLLFVGLMAPLARVHGQTALLNYGGKNDAADSTPLAASGAASNYQAVFQQVSPSIPTIGTTAPTLGAGTGTTVFVDANQGFASIACEATGGTGSGAGMAMSVYDTTGTAGTAANNPLALGTGAATPNVFSVGAKQTIVYSVDFKNNYHATDVISLFNPKASDADPTSAVAQTKGGYLGVALTFAFSATTGKLAFQGQKSFSGSLDAASEGSGDLASVSSNGYRLILNLTNNGDGTDTISGTVFSITAMGGIGAPLGTLNPETITLGTVPGAYDLDNNAMGLELGLLTIANVNLPYYLSNVSLTQGAGAPATAPASVTPTSPPAH